MQLNLGNICNYSEWMLSTAFPGVSIEGQYITTFASLSDYAASINFFYSNCQLSCPIPYSPGTLDEYLFKFIEREFPLVGDLEN